MIILEKEVNVYKAQKVTIIPDPNTQRVNTR